jgi:hypothetical protein
MAATRSKTQGESKPMTHTFNIKSTFQTVETYPAGDHGEFTVELGYAPDTTQLDLVYDPSEDFYQQLVDDITEGRQEHFVARVRCLYGELAVAESYLSGIVYASARDWFMTSADPALEQMTDRVVSEGTDRCRALLARLMEDFGND